MKIRIAILSTLLCCCGAALAQINLSNQEPTIVFGMTNAFGRPDTNYFRVIPIQNPVLANGTIITRGIAIRMYPDTNGIAYTNFAMGWFQMSNQFLGQGIIFEVPNNTNSYWAGSLARSGFNTYEMTGVLGLSSSNGTVSIIPANGTGFVDLATTGQGSGSVTSIGLSMPAEFSVAGSPVTTAGTISVTKSTETANTIFAGPSSGGALAPTFRALVAADIPRMALPSLFSGYPISDTSAHFATWLIDPDGTGGVVFSNAPTINSATFSGTTAMGAVTATSAVLNSVVGHGGGLTNLAITGTGAALVTTNANGIVNILASNNVPVAGANITIVTNATATGATYTIAGSAGGGGGYITVQTNKRIFTYSAIGTTTPSALGTSLTIGGTGGGNLAVVPDNSNPARLRLYSGAAAGDDESISDNNSCFAIQKPATLSWRFALTNTANARAFAGMCSSADNALQHDFLTTAGFINGFGFIFAQTNNSHWQLSSLQLSGSITNLITTIVADTSPHTFTILSSTTSVAGYIDGALVGTLTNCYPVLGGGLLLQAVGISSSSTTAEGLEFVQFYGEQDF